MTDYEQINKDMGDIIKFLLTGSEAYIRGKDYIYDWAWVQMILNAPNTSDGINFALKDLIITYVEHES